MCRSMGTLLSAQLRHYRSLIQERSRPLDSVRISPATDRCHDAAKDQEEGCLKVQHISSNTRTLSATGKSYLGLHGRALATR